MHWEFWKHFSTQEKEKEKKLSKYILIRKCIGKFENGAKGCLNLETPKGQQVKAKAKRGRIWARICHVKAISYQPSAISHLHNLHMEECRKEHLLSTAFFPFSLRKAWTRRDGESHLPERAFSTKSCMIRKAAFQGYPQHNPPLPLAYAIVLSVYSISWPQIKAPIIYIKMVKSLHVKQEFSSPERSHAGRGSDFCKWINHRAPLSWQALAPIYEYT